MKLSYFEFSDSPESSYNGMIGQLVTGLRYAREEVSANEFGDHIPALQKIERDIVKIDRQVSRDPKNYLQLLMQEMDQETEIENDLTEELKVCCRVILQQKFELDDFVFENIVFELIKHKSLFWLEYYGFKGAEREMDLVVKQIFQSICNRYQVIFIDALNIK